MNHHGARDVTAFWRESVAPHLHIHHFVVRRLNNRQPHACRRMLSYRLNESDLNLPSALKAKTGRAR